jgi:hypothetical protein
MYRLLTNFINFFRPSKTEVLIPWIYLGCLLLWVNPGDLCYYRDKLVPEYSTLKQESGVLRATGTRPKGGGAYFIGASTDAYTCGPAPVSTCRVDSFSKNEAQTIELSSYVGQQVKIKWVPGSQYWDDARYIAEVTVGNASIYSYQQFVEGLGEERHRRGVALIIDAGLLALVFAGLISNIVVNRKVND